MVQAPSGAAVVLDAEHDEFAWLPLADAIRRCLPSEVGACISGAAAWLDGPG